VKAVAAKNLHITLKFLGDTDSDSITEITDRLYFSTQSKPAITLGIVGLSAFPRHTRPSVVWAGIEDSGTLAEIAEKLQAELKPLGFKRDKRLFQPHLTLARVRGKPPEELFTLINNHQSTDFGTASVDSIELIQSELRPEGARYTLLASVHLDQ